MADNQGQLKTLSKNNIREIHLKQDSQEFELLPFSTKEIKGSFDFSEILKNEEKFEKFIIDNLSIIELDSPQEISNLIRRGSQNLFFGHFFEKTPLLSEFIFQSLQTPSSIAKLLRIGIEFNKVLVFFFLMILTFVLSHFLGEMKFNYEPLSMPRIGQAFFRIGLVNIFRIGIFSFLFSENIAPSFTIFLNSVQSLSDHYPMTNFLLSPFL